MGRVMAVADQQAGRAAPGRNDEEVALEGERDLLAVGGIAP